MQNWLDGLFKALAIARVPARYQIAVARVAVTATRRNSWGR
jgi:hypothetical protein